MGFWDWDAGSVVAKKSSHGGVRYSVEKKKHRSRSRSRSRSKSRSRIGSILGVDSHHHHHHHKHSSSKSSFFGFPNVSKTSFFGLPNASRSGFFGLGRGSSYYKRSPRHGFVHRAYKHLRRLLRDLVYYAKRHPVKVFMLVLMPLITGGALTALLARFGLRLPPTIERMMGLASRAASGDGIGLVGEAMRMASGGGNVSIERGRDGGMQWERRSVERDSGWGDGLMGVAKMFI